ncbi:MAG: O-antigen ligase family protein [Clostridiales bacterium]|nr:O-antigen ligase family protein [Clostridiales bacterium]
MKTEKTGCSERKFDCFIPNLEIIFKACYLVHLLMAFNAYFAGENIMNVTLCLTLLFGGLMGITRLIRIKDYIKFPNVLCLIAFIGSYALTALVNFRYGLFESAQYFIWLLFQFGLLYAFDAKREFGEIKKELYIIAYIAIVVLTIYNIIGITMLMQNKGFWHEAADGQVHRIGMTEWGRLHGLHADPNYGAVTSAVGLLLALYLIMNTKKKWIKAALCVTIAFQYLFIVFSVSRSGLIAAMCGTGAFVGLYYLKKAKKLPVLVAAASVIITVGAMFAGSKVLINSYNIYMEQRAEQSGDENIIKEPTISREGDMEATGGDISNRRFSIWKSAMEIFLSRPIFGVGFRNIVPYAKDQLPGTYILEVNNEYGDFDAMHNMLMDTLASQGIIGISLLACFVIGTIVFFCKNFSKIKEEHWMIDVVLFCSCMTIGISSMFVSQILYVNNPNTYLFWALLGYLIYFIKKDAEQQRGRGKGSK